MNISRKKQSVACAMVFALVGCGGGGDSAKPPEDSLQAYRTQTLSWSPCAPSILAPDFPDLKAIGYEERLQCAMVRAPLDYENPARGDVQIAITRLKAPDSAKRRGALLVNPGGPGSDGLAESLRLAFAYEKYSDPETSMGALQMSLLAAYDMIGFSPRGVGASTQLACGSNEVLRAVDGTPEGHTPAMIQDMIYNARIKAQACQKNPITPFINTDATARDMDLIRGLLGDEKLNYLGYSYGTWLGGWYAALFPDRVGRMVLDGNTDFSSNDLDGDIRRRQPPAIEQVWERVYLRYAARHADKFGLGQSAQDVRMTYMQVRQDVRRVLTPKLMSQMYKPELSIDEAMFSLAGARGLSTVLNQYPTRPDAQTLDRALQNQVFASGNSYVDASARSNAREMLVEMDDALVTKSVALSAGDAVYVAVRCNDSIANTDADYWINLSNNYAQKNPWDLAETTAFPCTFWKGGPTVKRPDVAALASSDILMVQSQWDAATPVEGAMKAFAALPKGHMVYVEKEAAHGTFPYMTACVDAPVIRYLLGESPGARTTTCEAKALPLDTPSVATVTKSAQMKSATSASGFTDPDAAAKLIAGFKRNIGPVR